MNNPISRKDLVDAYQDSELMLKLRGIAGRIVGPQNSEDVIQTVFLNLIKRVENQSLFDKNLPALLKQAIANKAIDVIRKSSRFKLQFAEVEEIDNFASTVDIGKSSQQDRLRLYQEECLDCLGLYEEESEEQRKIISENLSKIFQTLRSLMKNLLNDKQLEQLQIPEDQLEHDLNAHLFLIGFVLRSVANLKQKNVAKILNIPHSTATKGVYKIQRKLKSLVN